VLSSAVNVIDTARDLGVTIDSMLTMADQVATTCQSAYFQLRQLWLITRSLSSDATKAVVQAFIMCRLDYCNSLLFGIADDQRQRLQAVQNATVHLVSGAHRLDHITPVL